MWLRNKERAGGTQSSLPPARHGDWGCATRWWLPLQPHSSFPDHSESISTLARSFCFLFPPTLFLGPAGISCVGLSHPPPVSPGLSYQGCLQGRVIPLVGTLVALETGLDPAGGPQLPTPTWRHPHIIRLAALESEPLPAGWLLGDPPVFMHSLQPPRQAGAAGTHQGRIAELQAYGKSFRLAFTLCGHGGNILGTPKS